MLAENGVTNIAKYYFPGNLEICFQTLVSSGKARVHIFHCYRTVVSVSKCINCLP